LPLATSLYSATSVQPCAAVRHGRLPAEKLHRLLKSHPDVVVIGLHSVFEHHAAMTDVALEAFIHEYHLTLPISIGEPGKGSAQPVTMARFGMRGTPTTVVINRDGQVIEHHFGQVEDLRSVCLSAPCLPKRQQLRHPMGPISPATPWCA
jgi:hypothetical protein